MRSPSFFSRENATPEILGAHSVVKLVKTTLAALQKTLAFLILEHFLLEVPKRKGRGIRPKNLIFRIGGWGMLGGAW